MIRRLEASAPIDLRTSHWLATQTTFASAKQKTRRVLPARFVFEI
jgi:hypothetical protein